MRVHKNEHVTPFDVDKTLILPYDPESKNPWVWVYDAVTNSKIKMTSHMPNIRLLKEEHHRGSHIIVWSRGGYEWAEAVIEALGLEKYVSDVYTKPYVYFDDLDVKEWMNQRVYLAPDAKYK